MGLFTATGEVLNILKQLTVWCRGLQRTEEQERERKSDYSGILLEGGQRKKLSSGAPPNLLTSLLLLSTIISFCADPLNVNVPKTYLWPAFPHCHYSSAGHLFHPVSQEAR